MNLKITLCIFLFLVFASCRKARDQQPVIESEFMSVSMGNTFSASGDKVGMDIKSDTFMLHMQVSEGGRFPKYLDFTFQMDSVTGPGTYVFLQGQYAFPDNVIAVLDLAQSNPNSSTTEYLGITSRTRLATDTGCRVNINPIGPHKLTIAKWGEVNEVVEGTFSGSVFSDAPIYWINCLNSYEFSYSGSFRLKRKW